eukprot:95967_1
MHVSLTYIINMHDLRSFICNWDCYESPHLLVIMCYVIQIVVLIAILVIFTWNLHQLLCKTPKTQQLDDFLKQTSIKILYITINCLYVMGMIGYVIAFTSSLDCWMRGHSGVHLFYYTMVVANGSMSIGGACVYFFFLLRIKHLFHLRWTFTMLLFVTVFIAQILCQIASITFYSKSKIGLSAWNNGGLIFSIGSSLLNVAFNTCLILYFVFKIFAFNKQLEHAEDHIVITFTLRHLYSALVCLISTNVLGFLKLIRLLKNTFLWFTVQNALTSVDALLTLFFLLIQFRFANRIYDRISCCCDCIVKSYLKSHAPDSNEMDEEIALTGRAAATTLQQKSPVARTVRNDDHLLVATTTATQTIDTVTTTSTTPDTLPHLNKSVTTWDLDNSNTFV